MIVQPWRNEQGANKLCQRIELNSGVTVAAIRLNGSPLLSRPESMPIRQD